MLAVDANGNVNLPNLFTPLTAYTFLVFCLLYPPCIASIATMRKELESRSSTVAIIIYELGIAWVVAFVVRHIGLMLGFN